MKKDDANSERRSAFGLQMLPDASSLSGSEFVFRQLFDAILSQRLLPGARLQEVALAKLFSVGRSAVREALLRLERVGLAESRVNRGSQVAQPAADEVAAILDARTIIECALIERTIQRLHTASITAAQLEPLRSLARDEGEHLAAGRRGAALRLSCEQHLSLARLAGNNSLAECLVKLVPQTALAITTYEKPDHNFCGWQSRLKLLDVIEKGSAVPAVEAMHSHLEALQQSMDTTTNAAESPLDRAFAHLSDKRG